MNFTDLWAKSDPYHPLWRHLLDAAAVCEQLLRRFGSVTPIPDRWVMFLIAMHDVGKADPEFQNKDPKLAAKLCDLGWILHPEVTRFRHEARSASWIIEHLMYREGWGQLASAVAQQAIRGHHGDFRADCKSENGLPTQADRWNPFRGDLARIVRDALQLEPWSIHEFDDASAVGLKLSGLIILSDWIASNDELFHYADPAVPTDITPVDYFAWARTEAEAAMRRLDLQPDPAPDPDSRPVRFVDLWPACESLRPSQRALDELLSREDIPPGLAIIEAPMGEGKTEAAIYLAERWRCASGASGAYFALPTMATSNQMHGRYQEFLERQRPGRSPRLVHGMAWLIDEVAPSKEAQTWGWEDRADQQAERATATEWFRNTRRALIAPEAVGTVDQALRAALDVKFGLLRLLGLSSKVLIIDEVHAYDEYMTVLMERLLEWLSVLHVPVILLSATLSFEQKRRLVEAYRGADILPRPQGIEPYPLLTFVPLQGDPKIVPVEQDSTRDREIEVHLCRGLLEDSCGTARLAASLVEAGGCACVLVNTVKSAQAIFRNLRRLRENGEIADDIQLLLFHARFRAGRRAHIERKIISLFGKEVGPDTEPKRPARAILVATQVVEQSLDVDFDILISEIAPIDLLLQRCGRVYRHERGPRVTGPAPRLYVLLPPEGSFDFGSTGKVYEAEPLLRTLAILSGREPTAPEDNKTVTIRLPEEFRPLIEAIYGGRPVPGGIVDEDTLRRAAEKRQKKLDEARQKAAIHLNPAPSDEEFTLAALNRCPVEDAEENERADYFHAQTRLGDDSLRALILHDDRLIGALDSSKLPPRRLLKELFLQQAGIPGWWLNGVKAEDGKNPYDGPKWLRGSLILRMRDGAWRGVNSDGKPVLIRDLARSSDAEWGTDEIGLTHTVGGREESEPPRNDDETEDGK